MPDSFRYCPDCGAVVEPGEVTTGSKRNRRPFVLAGVLVCVLLGGVAVAFAVSSDDSDGQEALAPQGSATETDPVRLCQLELAPYVDQQGSGVTSVFQEYGSQSPKVQIVTRATQQLMITQGQQGRIAGNEAGLAELERGCQELVDAGTYREGLP